MRREVDGIRQSIREIADHVDNLSEETLADWEEKSDEALGQTAEEAGAAQS